MIKYVHNNYVTQKHAFKFVRKNLDPEYFEGN